MSDITTLRYAVNGDGDFEDSYELRWDRSLQLQGLEWMAESAAEDYFDNHDGWESKWPLRIAIWDADGNKLGECDVDREDRPHFIASAIGEGGDTDGQERR